MGGGGSGEESGKRGEGKGLCKRIGLVLGAVAVDPLVDFYY